MGRQLISLAVFSLALLVQLATVCNARAYLEDEDLDYLLAKNYKRDGFHGVEDSSSDDDDDDEYAEDDDALYSFDGVWKRNSRAGSGLSSTQKKKIVNIHNALRRREGASDMQKMKYSNRLAQLAQDWSDRCDWGHRPKDTFNPSDYGFSSVGENIWASTGNDAIPEKPIAAWFSEKSGFHYDTNFCSKPPCGHYTAVVWSSTTAVGCGVTKCPILQNSGMTNAYYVVCNYGPAGNMIGQLPYKKGPPCSECSTGKFFCSKNLCDSSCKSAGRGNKCKCKASCGNGSQTSDCKCQCNPGYSGVSCNERCEDQDPMCGANPGWPASWCTDKSAFGGMMYDTVNEKCPKMCGKCAP